MIELGIDWNRIKNTIFANQRPHADHIEKLLGNFKTFISVRVCTMDCDYIQLNWFYLLHAPLLRLMRIFEHHRFTIFWLFFDVRWLLNIVYGGGDVDVHRSTDHNRSLLLTFAKSMLSFYLLVSPSVYKYKSVSMSIEIKYWSTGYIRFPIDLDSMLDAYGHSLFHVAFSK